MAAGTIKYETFVGITTLLNRSKRELLLDRRHCALLTLCAYAVANTQTLINFTNGVVCFPPVITALTF